MSAKRVVLGPAEQALEEPARLAEVALGRQRLREELVDAGVAGGAGLSDLAEQGDGPVEVALDQRDAGVAEADLPLRHGGDALRELVAVPLGALEGLGPGLVGLGPLVDAEQGVHLAGGGGEPALGQDDRLDADRQVGQADHALVHLDGAFRVARDAVELRQGEQDPRVLGPLLEHALDEPDELGAPGLVEHRREAAHRAVDGVGGELGGGHAQQLVRRPVGEGAQLVDQGEAVLGAAGAAEQLGGVECVAQVDQLGPVADAPAQRVERAVRGLALLLGLLDADGALEALGLGAPPEDDVGAGAPVLGVGLGGPLEVAQRLVAALLVDRDEVHQVDGRAPAVAEELLRPVRLEVELLRAVVDVGEQPLESLRRRPADADLPVALLDEVDLVLRVRRVDDRQLAEGVEVLALVLLERLGLGLVHDVGDRVEPLLQVRRVGLVLEDGPGVRAGGAAVLALVHVPVALGDEPVGGPGARVDRDARHAAEQREKAGRKGDDELGVDFRGHVCVLSPVASRSPASAAPRSLGRGLRRVATPLSPRPSPGAGA